MSGETQHLAVGASKLDRPEDWEPGANSALEA